MLSFELSAIDLILVIAVVILLILYMIRLSTKTALEEKLLATNSTMKAEKERLPEVPTSKNASKCAFHFGYLKELGRDSDIPDECLGCSRVMECLSTDE